jgi:hypothetical protein|tara:strand:+ start:174 stop:392 length:219 start_codon:yes stop_codon:yes gene_type:complete
MATPRPKSTPGRSVEEHDRLAVLGLKAAAKDFSQMVALRLSTEHTVDELVEDLQDLERTVEETKARLRKAAK